MNSGPLPPSTGSAADPDQAAQPAEGFEVPGSALWSALAYSPGRGTSRLSATPEGQDRLESPERLYGPLQRFLPPLPLGAAQDFLQTQLPGAAWILDPFGVAPHLPVELARAGYRVLVTSHNPITRFLIDLCARPPTPEQLQATLADLGALPHRDERLEPHLKSLYRTECVQCKSSIMAEAYVWERGAEVPSSRIYRCPFCGDEGERPATEADVQLVQQTRLSPLHHARALERVAPLSDPDRAHVQEALTMYTPRALYVLVTLINRLDSLPPHRRRLLEALLLPVFDQSCALWPYPATRSRPRQLSHPPRYRENNIWLALEQAAENNSMWKLCQTETSAEPVTVPLTLWPELPPESGGICLFSGRLKDLLQQQAATAGQKALPRFQALITAVPRPNQAFWTLSALWAGWLWGSQAVTPFKSVLRRRRYDWAWHTAGLHAALNRSVSRLEPEARLWLLAAECEPPFLTALFLAAGTGHLPLSGIAIRHPQDAVQIAWRYSPGAEQPAVPVDREALSAAAARAAQRFLELRGEPVHYLILQAAALTSLSAQGALGALLKATAHTEADEAADSPRSLSEAWSQLQEIIQQAFSHLHGFYRFGGSRSSPESGLWWHAQLSPAAGSLTLTKQSAGEADQDRPADRVRPADKVRPANANHPTEELSLSDRLEMELVRNLIQQPGSTCTELEARINATFRGLFTPRLDLFYEVILSYGEEEPPDSGRWQLRAQESPAVRRSDLRTIADLLVRLGQRLGCQVILPTLKSALPQNPVLWKTSGGEPAAVFYPLASALLSRVVLFEPPELASAPAARRVIVVPGSRARLIEFKLRHDPRLRQAVEERWTLIKFRHVRRLAENPLLTLENLDENLNLDPLANTDPQISLW